MRRDIENVQGRVELIVQRAASELLLVNDAERQLRVKRLLSLWNDCTNTMLAKGNSVTEELLTFNGYHQMTNNTVQCLSHAVVFAMRQFKDLMCLVKSKYNS